MMPLRNNVSKITLKMILILQMVAINIEIMIYRTEVKNNVNMMSLLTDMLVAGEEEEELKEEGQEIKEEDQLKVKEDRNIYLILYMSNSNLSVSDTIKNLYASHGIDMVICNPTLHKNTLTMDDDYPFVSICTPTYNRRPFIELAIECVKHQTYPKNRIEWIITDDGTDKIGDIVQQLPYVRYISLNHKMSLGKKRNLMNSISTGSIIVYMDDDDYYPQDRITHAVSYLVGSSALIAGSSAMPIYFTNNKQLYLVGPYGKCHATAATFAFKKELLLQAKFNDASAVGEEVAFLSGLKPEQFIQLDPFSSIIVLAHKQNSVDKEFLKSPAQLLTGYTIDDFIFNKKILHFIRNAMNNIELYEPGHIRNKPDVIAQIIERKQIQQQKKQQQKPASVATTTSSSLLIEYNNTITKLTMENIHLKNKIAYLTEKLNALILSGGPTELSVSSTEEDGIFIMDEDAYYSNN